MQKPTFLSTLPARGATPARRCPQIPKGFLSTLPARGATAGGGRAVKIAMISIHAPREGSDVQDALVRCKVLHFYPRSPRGERHRNSRAVSIVKRHISIHAPREGSDTIGMPWLLQCRDFYPRSPRGERRAPRCRCRGCRRNFYPRSPRGERQASLPPFPQRAISIHAPREGSDIPPKGLGQRG